jgi:galactokinase
LPAPTSPTFVAPARVNLLGEHTDYTGGFVLPMAIPFTTQASITPATDGNYTFTSDLFPDAFTLPLGATSTASRHWSDYPVGVLQTLKAQADIHPPAFHLHLSGNVPFGAGVSSSASVEVASAYAMLSLAGQTMPPSDLALLCQSAENNYVHSPCGIMDQFVITNARTGHALLLNTRDLTFEHLPMNQGKLAETRIVVANSMVKHSIGAGEYGKRRLETETGQLILRGMFRELTDLGDATLDQLNACKRWMPEEAFRRCHHIISENARVLEAKSAMLAGDPVALGKLMLAGHISERDDFECSCDEVDFLVETAAALPGCFGARLTGGGFGGCTVNLVAASAVEAFTTALTAAYQQRFHIAAETYTCEAVDGAFARNENLVEST